MKPAWFVGATALLAVLWWRRRSLERMIMIIGLIAAAGMVVYGTGVVHFPDVDKVLEHVGTALGPWTYLLVATMAYAETGAFLGFIAPGETVVLVGGMVAGQGQINLAALIAVCWIMAVAGDLTSFALGRRYGRDFLVRHGARVHITEARIAQVEHHFAKRGGASILIGRFIGFVRPLAPFLAGSSDMPLRQFVAYDVLAAGIWSAVFSVLGFAFWQSLDKVLAVAKQGSLVLGAVLVGIIAIVAAVRWIRDQTNRDRLERIGHRVADHPIARPFVAVGRPIMRLLRGPGGFVLNRITPGDLGLELTALASIVAASSFVFIGYLATISDGSITFGDRRGLQWAADLATPWLTHVGKAVTTLGIFPVAFVALAFAVAWFMRRRRRLEAAALAIGFVITLTITQLVKDQLRRPRPPGALVTTSGWAFPSGHTSNGVVWLAIGVALWRVLPAWPARAAAIAAGAALTVAVGLSRIYLRAHWWSDVAAGWGLGIAVYALCGALAVVIQHRRAQAAGLDQS